MIQPFAHRRRVCIVGAGPVGSLLAILWSRRGVRLNLLEARPDNVRRLGGEWLHPAAVDLLKQACVAPHLTQPIYKTGLGFVVFPEDGSEPISLPYGEDRRGSSFEHAELVTTLRDAAIRSAGVEYIPYAKVAAIHGRTVKFIDRSGAVRSLEADLIVGADGRSSGVRRSSIGERRRRFVSCMAGVLLKDVAMPCEGFGHVFIGGPGPILAYRIGVDRVRLCLDVPATYCTQGDLVGFLRERYSSFLPELWREPFRDALRIGQTTWAKNEVEPRDVYGTKCVRLVGDAVGCLHPITAAGMTLGFEDAECLIAEPSWSEYQSQRRAGCAVPQALTSSLYAAFARHDESALTIRRAIYRLWRQRESYRRDTMRLLCAEDANIWRFRRILLEIGAMGIQAALREIVSLRQWRNPSSALRRIQRQLCWLDDRLL